MERKLTWLTNAVLGTALVVLVLSTPTGPSWDAASGYAVLAAHLERTAGAPLYGVLAGIAAQLPVGEVGFRLGLLGAVLGAFTLAGVVAAARALLPKDPLAGVIGALLLVLAPPFREAAAFAAPSILAACGAAWALAAAAEHARAPSPGRVVRAFAMLALVVGSAPWLGAALGLVLVIWLARAGARRDLLAGCTGALGLLIVVLWFGATGRLPDPTTPSLSAMVASSGRGAAAVVIGTGLLGAAFAAVTGLASARWLVLAIALALAHAIVVDPAPAPLLALLAVGAAIVPSAIVRVLPSARRELLTLVAGAPLVGAALLTGAHAIVVDPAPAPLLALLAVGAAIVPSAIVRVLPSARRELLTLVAGAPLVGAALLTGPGLTVDDPGAAPARLATDVIGALPPGPGVIVATRDTTWLAIHYAQTIAGARPDLSLAPPMPPTIADGLVADSLRAGQVAGADVPAIGRLDPARAVPRGRGFELRGEPLDVALPVAPPARYASAIGEQEAIALALARARYEAGLGRLEAAARAAGLTDRFRAADLALLATATPVRARPALFGFVPRLGAPPGTWLLDLFGDDLAWVAGIEQPATPVDAPPARRLHALWRDVLTGARRADDPEIVALGPAAVAATREMLATLRPATEPAGD